jgi:hypothetical protein|tara:strand:+ start:261 stop:644 length:384 start_codon:yes stop_codon:yes gene_type:complete
MAKQLTENQQKFLEVLFDEAAGDVLMAKRIAGYSDGTPTRSITEALKDEIFEATKSYMSRLGPKAAIAYGSALDDPTQLGVKERMIAAGQVLDRSGLVKTEKVAVESSGGLFILPPKDSSTGNETQN